MKNRNYFTLIYIVILLVVILYLTYCFGAALHDSKSVETEQGALVVVNLFEQKLANPFQDFLNYAKTGAVQKTVAAGAFGWLLCVAYVANNKRNFIHGKKYAKNIGEAS